MDEGDEFELPDPDHDDTECTPGNPCCYRLELGVQMALSVDILVCLLGIAGCLTGGIYQLRFRDTEINRATKPARSALVWSFCSPVGLFFISFAASVVLLCNRTFWACVLWLVAKIVLLLVVAIILRFVHLEMQAFNDAILRVSHVYQHKQRDMKVMTAAIITVGSVLAVFGIWFIWAVGAYAIYIRRNLVLRANVVTVLDQETQDSRAFGHVLDAWEEDTLTQRPYEVTPHRVPYN